MDYEDLEKEIGREGRIVIPRLSGPHRPDSDYDSLKIASVFKENVTELFKTLGEKNYM